jgi:nucleoside-diphosphate-sugar epimerase
MKILITGSHGFVGSKLRVKIPKAICLDLKNGNDLLTCRLPKKIDVIYHLAAQTSVEDSWSDPLKDSYNYNMTVRLAQTYPNTKIIFAQSAAAIEASSPYGLSKLVSGMFLREFHKELVVCTFPNVYGGGKGVVDLFKGKKEVTIYGDGEQVRDFVHVDDIVEGLLKAQNWPKGGYFMGSGVGTKVRDLAAGKSIIWAPARQEIRESILPNTTPDWKPQRSVMEYLK